MPTSCKGQADPQTRASVSAPACARAVFHVLRVRRPPWKVYAPVFTVLEVLEIYVKATAPGAEPDWKPPRSGTQRAGKHQPPASSVGNTRCSFPKPPKPPKPGPGAMPRTQRFNALSHRAPPLLLRAGTIASHLLYRPKQRGSVTHPTSHRGGGAEVGLKPRSV